MDQMLYFQKLSCNQIIFGSNLITNCRARLLNLQLLVNLVGFKLFEEGNLIFDGFLVASCIGINFSQLNFWQLVDGNGIGINVWQLLDDNCNGCLDFMEFKSTQTLVQSTLYILFPKRPLYRYFPKFYSNDFPNAYIYHEEYHALTSQLQPYPRPPKNKAW